MQDSNGNIISRAAVGLAIGTISAFSLFIGSSAAWSAVSTSVALQALIAFLTIIAASWMYIYFSRTRLLSHAILFSFLIALSVIHIGGAIPLLCLDFPTITKTAPDKISDILEVTMIGIALALASVTQHSILREKTNSWVIPIVVFVVLASYGVVYFFLLVRIAEQLLVLVACSAGIGTMLLLLYCIFFYSRMPFSFKTNDAALYLASIQLFLLSVVPLLLSMIFATLVWAISLTLQALAMLLFVLAISMPSQRKMHMSDREALRVPIFYSLLAIVPFLLSILAQVALPALLIINIPAYQLSHVAAAGLSGVMTYLIYAHYRRKPREVQLPLLLVFASWTIIEVFILLTLNVESFLTYGESLVPYIIGTMVSSYGLLGAAKWANQPETTPKDELSKWIVWRAGAVGVLLILGTYLEGIFLLEYLGLQQSPLGRFILLSTNLAIMSIIIYLTYTLAKEMGSWNTFEGCAIGFLSLWIAPHILKGIYLDFQFGWWGGELILLAGLLLGPAVFGSLYLKELKMADTSQRRAILYSDILIHDISNLHQAIVVSLELIEEEDANVDMQRKALEDATASLQRANQLIRNVRHLGQLEQDGYVLLRPVDLDASIIRAIRQIEIENPDAELEIAFESTEGKHFVLADELLNDLWYNILRNSVMYSPERKLIHIEISKTHSDGRRYWRTAITDRGQGIPPETKAGLFKRFMQGAKGSGLGLSVVHALTAAYNGRILVSDRVAGDYRQGTVFSVLLSCAEDEQSDIT